MKKNSSLDQIRLPVPLRAKKEMAQLIKEDAEVASSKTIEQQNKQFMVQAKKMHSLLVPLKKMTGTPRKKQKH